MTYQASPVWVYPRFPLFGSVAGSSLGANSTFTMNGAGDKVAFLFQAVSTTPPDKAQFVIPSFTSTGTVDVTIEPLSSLQPSGTPVSSTNTVSQSITGTGTITISGLAGSGSLTVGGFYALVITAASGFGGNFQILLSVGSSQGQWASGIPITKDSAGSWNTATSSGNANAGSACGLFYSGDIPLAHAGHSGAYTGANIQGWSDSTNPDQRGNLWKFPFPVRVIGMGVLLTYGSGYDSGENWTAYLHTDPTGTPSQIGSAVGTPDGLPLTQLSKFIFWAEGAQDIAANTSFALSVKATSSGQINVVRWDYDANLNMRPLVGSGNVYSCTRNNASGAFSADDTKLYGVVPLLSAFDDATGGGSDVGRAIYNIGL